MVVSGDKKILIGFAHHCWLSMSYKSTASGNGV